MRRLAATLALLCGCAGARGPAAAPASVEDAYVAAVREEARALRRIERLVAWQEGALGEQAAASGALAGHRRLFSRTALDALARAEHAPGQPDGERKALAFLRRSLAARALAQATAPYDEELRACVSIRELPASLSAEPDRDKREAVHRAWLESLDARLNPILERREQAAQAAAREAGYADYAALAEDVRSVDLRALLAEGAAAVRATDAAYLAALDRVAREELGVGREALRASDLPRLFDAPSLLRFFAPGAELDALRAFVGGLGLTLSTSSGAEFLVDAEPRPAKSSRAFVAAIDPLSDVRLSVSSRGGLRGFGSLFHEAGHALHFAASAALPSELVELGHLAPSEAFGELFRGAFAEPRWLRRLMPSASGPELAAVIRRAVLGELSWLRQTAFARIAFELRLHGRPMADLGPALALLPAPAAAEADLRELYRQLFSVATGVPFGRADAARYLSDVDDLFYAADYARAFALAAMLDDALSARFGDWTSQPAAGSYLRAELFAQGRALSADEVAFRVAGAPRVDFGAAARRAQRLLAHADELERAP